MRFNRDASVVTASGEDVGRIDRVVVNPQNGEVSHLVVRKGMILTEDKVVPLEMVAEANEDRVVLRAGAGQLERLPHFEETHYVRADEAEGEQASNLAANAPPYYWYPPIIGLGPVAPATPGLYGYPGPSYVAETERNIPPGTVALREGATVKTRDGQDVGKIEELIVSEGMVTHVIVASGLIHKTRRLIPAHWVTSAGENELQLAVEARMVERLQPYERG